MCNLSEGIVDRVTAEVTKRVTEEVTKRITEEVTWKVDLRCVRSLMKNTGWPVEKAMAALDVPESMRPAIMKALGN